MKYVIHKLELVFVFLCTNVQNIVGQDFFCEQGFCYSKQTTTFTAQQYCYSTLQTNVHIW